MSLVVISTHPIQYHAPVYRAVQQQYNIPVTVIYGSAHSVVGYRDKEFGVSFAWDTDLLSGYTATFLNRGSKVENFDPCKIKCRGLETAIDEAQPKVILILGYAFKLYQRAWLHAIKKGYPIIFRMETYDEFHKIFFLKRLIRDRFLKYVYSRGAAFLPPPTARCRRRR